MSIHEFYRFKGLITLEQVSTTEKSEKKKESSLAKLRWSGVVNFHCVQMVLWWALGLFSAMIELTCQ